MAYVELACYKIAKLNMINNILDTEIIEGTNRDHFSVSYNEDNSMAIATLTEYVEIEDKPSKFRIELSIEGVFMIDDVKSKAEKKAVHRKYYDDLFPIAQQIIKFLTIHSGMSEGVTIQKRTLKQVNAGSMPEKRSEKLIDFPTNI